MDNLPEVPAPGLDVDAEQQTLAGRQVTVHDMLNLLLIAMGKKAASQDPHDWRLISRSNQLIEEQWLRGHKAGIKDGMMLGYNQAIDDARRDAEELMKRMMREGK